MRKLAVFSLSFSAAIFLALYLLPLNTLLLLVPLLAAAGFVAAFIKRSYSRAAAIILISAAVGMTCFYCHYRLKANEAEKYSGGEYLVTARAVSYPDVHDSYSAVEVDIVSDSLPKLRMRLYCANDELQEVKPGDILGFKAKLYSAAKSLKNGNPVFSNGVFLKGSAKSSIARYSEFDVRLLPSYAQHAVVKSIKENFPKDVQAFILSLVSGDRDEMYADSSLTLAFSRSGLSHVVAVSGMHVAFLLSCIQIFLGKGRRNALISIVIIWFFAFMTGASPSALRAAFMQTMVLMAPLLRREYDPVTSLSFALAVILSFDPFAGGSVSLQLSFAAMAGMIYVTPSMTAWLLGKMGRAGEKRTVSKLVAIFSASVGVLLFTMPLMALHFGAIAIFAPLSNLLAVWAVSLCFGSSLICALIGILFPLAARFLAWVIAWPARYIIFVAKIIASSRHAVIYTENRYFMIWMAALYVALLFCLIGKKHRKIKTAVSAVVLSAGLIAALVLPGIIYRSDGGTIAALDVGQGQCIVALSEGCAVMVDCGSINSYKNAGDTAASYLSSKGCDRLDILMLTHLHSDHVNGVERLCELVDVGMIILTENTDDSDGQLETIINCADRHGIRLITLQNDDVKSMGNIRLRMFAPGDEGDKNERCIISLLSIGEYDLLITADAPASAELELVNTRELGSVEAMIVGHHGSKNSSTYELLETVEGREAIISVGVNNYGHPAAETLERLDEYGYNVRRTDMDGTIEIKVA